MKQARITGTGSYLPLKVLTNQALTQMVDTSDEWIRERTGIQSRHIVGEDETTTTMAFNACQQALEAAGLEPDQIDLIIVGTATPDHFFPSTACELQRLLKIKKSLISFDISSACSGFIYGLVTAEQFIRSGLVKHALVVGSEVLSKVIDWEDRKTCVLFGDGAGACVLSAADEGGIIARHLDANGDLGDILKLPNSNTYDYENPYVQMSGREVFKFAITAICELTDQLIKLSGLTLNDIDWFIPHQANLRIIQSVCERLNYPIAKVSQDLVTQGNTSAASIPLALDSAIRSGTVKPGDKILMEGFGGGMTWGGVIIEL